MRRGARRGPSEVSQTARGSTPALYREFATQDELDAQYDASRMVPNASAYTDFYLQQSRAARAELECIADVAFGPTLAERLDIFPARRPDAPILIFVHGGCARAAARSSASSRENRCRPA